MKYARSRLYELIHDDSAQIEQTPFRKLKMRVIKRDEREKMQARRTKPAPAEDKIKLSSVREFFGISDVDLFRRERDDRRISALAEFKASQI